MSGRRVRHRSSKEGSKKYGRKNIVSEKVFVETMKVLQASTENKRHAKDSRLKPTKIDYFEAENCKAHHTDEYENKYLIVRRGQPFKISVTFDRPVNIEQHQIILQLATGSRPQQSKNSIIRLKDTKNLPTSSWGMKIIKHHEKMVEISVMSPVDATVGEYSVYLETRTKGSDGKYRSYRQLEAKKIYILFNAWCKDDSVYMDDEDHRKEYVLSDHGRIWIGSKNNPRGVPWNFGQFESVALEVCLNLLEMAEVKAHARGHPHSISRAISKMVNSNDDNGVLIGNWSGEYSDGTSPGAWTGSVAILKEFSKKKKSVKYGQCWVFSALVTTLLRAIGIPTRSVTNFESAHDNDKSMTIDYHFDAETDSPISSMNHDSVWNFHVWNESFFTRPDLPPGYDGWQAHDSTPQETSDGEYQCGPCPVKAIKKGEVYLPYDTGFVFAEVNGDRVYWDVDKDGEMTVSNIDKQSIGKLISTKAVGSNEREDLTNMYKFPERSQKERDAVKLANKYSSRKDIYPKESEHDVDFTVKTSEEVMIGDNFDIKLAIKNTSKEPRSVKVSTVAKISFYTGVVVDDLKNKTEEITVAAKEETIVFLPVMFDDYRKMAPDASIKVFFKAKVKETGQVFGQIDDVDFTKPELESDIPRDVNLNERLRVTFTFTNPLPVKLTNGKLNLESTRMNPSPLTVNVKKNIKPHAKVSIPVDIEYTEEGMRFIQAVFHSDQLSGVRGEFVIWVLNPSQ